MSDLDKRGFNRYLTDFKDFRHSQEKFLSGWTNSIISQYFYNQHLTKIYRGILDDHFTCDEKDKLEPLAIGLKKTIDKTNEDWSSHKWWIVPGMLGLAHMISYRKMNSPSFKRKKVISFLQRKGLPAKRIWYSSNMIIDATAGIISILILGAVHNSPYFSEAKKYTESLDPKLFKDFKDITNKEYYQRHLAIENQTPFMVENSRIEAKAQNSQKYIRKAVSDSFAIMEELEEQERQLEAFSKGEGFEKDKKEK